MLQFVYDYCLTYVFSLVISESEVCGGISGVVDLHNCILWNRCCQNDWLQKFFFCCMQQFILEFIYSLPVLESQNIL